MKTNRGLRSSLATAAAATITVFLTACYYIPGSVTGTANVGISAKGIPPNVTSAALVVTAPGMAPVSATAATTAGSITVTVPAGPARTFTLLLSNPSATLEGIATVDLQPGENTQISVTPTVGATQIVIPDLQNHRLVQISDMNGTGWITTIAGDFVVTGGATLSPYAVDFDDQGRIYVANDSPNSVEPLGGVFRFDDMAHPTPFQVVDGTYNLGIKALAVDRTNGLVYYGTGSTTLYQKSVNNIGVGPTTTTLTVSPKSIAVDDQGMLYMAIAGVVSTSFIPGYVVKFDPVKKAIVATSTYSFNSPFGIMVKGPYVYVSDNINFGGTGTAQVVRLDRNLQFVDSFGGLSTDKFYGPEAFVATLNRKFTIIDEKSNFNDRLASFDDMTGTGWTTFGSSGSVSLGPAIDQFDFYSVC